MKPIDILGKRDEEHSLVISSCEAMNKGLEGNKSSAAMKKISKTAENYIEKILTKLEKS
jgi:hypothetical protein